MRGASTAATTSPPMSSSARMPLPPAGSSATPTTCRPGRERLRARHRRALDAREVGRVVQPPVVHVEAEAAEAPALRDQHALGAAGGDLDVGDDPVRPHLDVRRQLLGHRRGARPQHDALARSHGMRAAEGEDAARLQRQHAVASRLAPPQLLERAQLLRLGSREVVRLGGVLRDVVELPAILVERTVRVVLVRVQAVQHRVVRHRLPAAVVDRAAGELLVVLRLAVLGRGARR